MKPKKTGFLAMLLSLLGLAPACNIIAPCMYGSPNADWSVKGKVIDENGKPVGGLQVVIDYNDQEGWPVDTLKTRSDGGYSLEDNGFPFHQLKVEVEDIDGEAGGGQFQKATLIVRDIQYKHGDGAWYSGHADIAVPDIVVYKKN